MPAKKTAEKKTPTKSAAAARNPAFMKPVQPDEKLAAVGVKAEVFGAESEGEFDDEASAGGFVYVQHTLAGIGDEELLGVGLEGYDAGFGVEGDAAGGALVGEVKSLDGAGRAVADHKPAAVRGDGGIERRRGEPGGPDRAQSAGGESH